MPQALKNSRCKGGSGERMGKSGENPGMAADESEELLDLDMEPKPESLWWTSTHQHGDMRTLSVGGRDKVWDLPFCEIFDVLGYRVCRDGKGFQGAECSMCKALRSWWRVKYIYRSKTVPMTTKRKRVHSHAYSTVLNGSRRVREKPRYCVSPSDLVWVTYRIRTSRSMRTSWKKKGLPLLTEKFAYDGDVPIMLALRSILERRTTAWWGNPSSCGMAWDPGNVQRWKHKVGFHNRGVQ